MTPDGPAEEDLWEQHAGWWQEGFTDGADPEYEEQILPLAAEWLRGTHWVLDVGTGEGQIARLAVKNGAGLVLGVDPTWGQLTVARERAGGPVFARGAAATLPCRSGAFEFRVVAAFHQRESWVQAAALGDSSGRTRVLAHEQTHFNIAELYARRMRQRFAGFSRPCRMSDDQLSAEARHILDEERVFQRRYDAETGHGLERREQTAWEANVRRQLGL